MQCRGGSGACPDTVDTTVGSCTDDVSDVSGFVEDGQLCISFTRPFNPGIVMVLLVHYSLLSATDSGTCDRAIDPTNQNQYIVWGIGALGETAFQHHTRASGTKISCGCRAVASSRHMLSDNSKNMSQWIDTMTLYYSA